jgi:hypothetical protein
VGAYYYASGQRIELEPDDEHVAVDENAAERAGLSTRLTASAGPFRQNGVFIVERKAVDEATLTTLRKAGALQSVYRRNRAMIVALPEVRIEVDNAKQRRAVMDLLADTKAPRHTITENTDERIVVKPASGNGDDALLIANEIYERAHPAAASVRFIQFVPKPSLRP